MTDAEPGSPEPIETPTRPGKRLRMAREAQGLSLADIGARTRVPQRHLEAIENGTYENLPSQTYAMGFARAYARAVGVDEVALASDVRADLNRNWNRPVHSIPAYQVEEPSRTPPKGLVWGGLIVAILLIVGLGLWYGTDLLRGGSQQGAAATPATEVAVPVPQTVAPAPPPAANDQVTVTATDEVWVRIYDGENKTLVMKTMAPGERYDIPAGTVGAQINVGRPDKLAITVGGKAVAPLGTGRVAIKDVSLAPSALLARGDGPASTTSASPSTRSGAPAARATSVSRPTAAAPTPVPTATPSDAAPGNASGL
ncbi:helix-turn-helix domain-containing protein [Sphingomonas sp. Leaf33]|uniref:helix-turn-helix domain-containing protein n=1 Tax=Sphingomonas sp. Leaf33 TaxID=1736215 RepID=UPI0009E741B6|nr:helix-turn-helix domain-containing protein [Sphingomonas sp. Leaf33]